MSNTSSTDKQAPGSADKAAAIREKHATRNTFVNTIDTGVSLVVLVGAALTARYLIRARQPSTEQAASYTTNSTQQARRPLHHRQAAYRPPHQLHEEWLNLQRHINNEANNYWQSEAVRKQNMAAYVNETIRQHNYNCE